MTEEEKRLAALAESGVVDSAPTEILERFVRIAQMALDVPVVLVSLVDDHRQFFANSIGLPSPWAERRETPLSHSFCKHVVDTRDALIVVDAPADERVKNNLAIRDLGVGAYAGFPINTEDSHTVGSFCAIDGKPRNWTARELAVLKDIAALVSAEVDTRRRMHRMARSERALEQLNDQLVEGQTRALELDQTFRHDLRSPLQVISLSVEAILRSADFAHFPQLARALALIQRNTAHVTSIVNLMKESDAHLDGLIAASDVVREAIQSYRNLNSGILVQEVHNDEVRIRINATNLRRCVENLLSNSMRFARSRINVSLQQDGNLATLTVEDDGPGLPSAQAYREVWASGKTFHRDQGRSGTGLGLNIVQSIIERAGGQVDAGPSELGGARFGLRLPVASLAETH
jgi:signal transduction histidine kinase